MLTLSEVSREAVAGKNLLIEVWNENAPAPDTLIGRTELNIADCLLSMPDPLEESVDAVEAPSKSKSVVVVAPKKPAAAEAAKAEATTAEPGKVKASKAPAGKAPAGKAASGAASKAGGTKGGSKGNKAPAGGAARPHGSRFRPLSRGCARGDAALRRRRPLRHRRLLLPLWRRRRRAAAAVVRAAAARGGSRCGAWIRAAPGRSAHHSCLAGMGTRGQQMRVLSPHWRWTRLDAH